MNRTIEIKHTGATTLVHELLDDLIDRLEGRLSHFRGDSLSVHVVFSENGTHKLYRTAVTCHVPGHLVAAHQENRNPGTSIRKAFAEVERQIEKYKDVRVHERLRKSRRIKSGRVAAANEDTE